MHFKWNIYVIPLPCLGLPRFVVLRLGSVWFANEIIDKGLRRANARSAEAALHKTKA